VVEKLIDGGTHAAAERRAVANVEVGTALDDREFLSTA
jgi:hypothetical protein